ncbi:hypothetical protein J5N97_025583 [Dioscorea zingiberensis]|uniref:Cytochrome P450 704C1 n=1 Tax=Dioscorea zingiberensis TaxID=325984 RepID=A0A9D5C8J2_9LILI|nr:hypothetical protein J5N97_025583 [Dioscorea zingiberensis]
MQGGAVLLQGGDVRVKIRDPAVAGGGDRAWQGCCRLRREQAAAVGLLRRRGSNGLWRRREECWWRRSGPAASSFSGGGRVEALCRAREGDSLAGAALAGFRLPWSLAITLAAPVIKLPMADPCVMAAGLRDVTWEVQRGGASRAEAPAGWRLHSRRRGTGAQKERCLGGAPTWRLTQWNKKKKEKYHPVVGTILHHLVNFGRLHDFSTDQAHKHKTFRLLSPLHSEVYTVDPANVEHILKTNSSNYGKGKYNYCNMKDLLGDGIFAVDGEKWQHQRKVASLDFSKRILRDYSTKTFKINAAKLAFLISEVAITNTTIDIQDLFMKSTMDSIFQVAFGVELDCLTASNREGREFAEAFDDASSLITWRYVDISWKIKKFLNIGCEAVLKEKIRIVDEFIYKMIHCKIEQMSKLQHDSIKLKREDMLSRFLIESEKDPVNITNQYLRDIILNFMIAGKDTTATTLSWFFYMLCKNPHIEKKIAKEVMRATKEFGQNASISEFASKIGEEIINNMYYLHASLTETLRLYPAIPLDPKICFSDDTLPDGFNVREGDIVAYMPYAMGRMKFIWGEDAELFRPERWLDDDGIYSPESPFKFTAFQAGPRICLGKEFAYRQMKIFATVLVRFFKFKLCDEKSVKYRTMLTLQIDHGLHLHAIQRKSVFMSSTNKNY